LIHGTSIIGYCIEDKTAKPFRFSHFTPKTPQKGSEYVFSSQTRITLKQNFVHAQWRRQDLVQEGAHAKITGFLQAATVDI